MHALVKSGTLLTIGKSVNLLPIYGLKVGNGPLKVLIWSQMHGNESTTTRAILHILEDFKAGKALEILDQLSIFIIPQLNPDGSKVYTRYNANHVDLNRDAVDQSQPESVALKAVFDEFKPDFCFNLHGQRTIFAAGKKGSPSTLSFLSPAADSQRLITPARLKAMQIIVAINNNLGTSLTNQIGRYEDTFNINCVGDTFQSLGKPTILFEAGHVGNDYNREKSRLYMFKALCYSLDYISRSDLSIKTNISEYHNIPQNKKCFFDIILSNIELNGNKYNLAIQYKEKLKDNSIDFQPQLEKINNLEGYFAHKMIDLNNKTIDFPSEKDLTIGSEIDFVIANNEKISLKIY